MTAQAATEIAMANLPMPKVDLVNEQPATTSLAIAECFGKEHKHVIRDIRNLIEECPQDFNGSNFGPVEYTDAKGEKRPMYTVYFDGFMLLVMGYTGKRALQMKLAYIEAFNAMKAELERMKLEAQNPRGDSGMTHQMIGEIAKLETRLRRVEWKIRKASMDQYCLFGPCPNIGREPASALPQGCELEVEPGRKLRYIRDADGRLWFSALDAVLLVYKNWTRGVIMRRIPAKLRSMKLFPWCRNGFGAHALTAEGVIYIFENCPHKGAKKLLGWFRNNFLPALA